MLSFNLPEDLIKEHKRVDALSAKHSYKASLYLPNEKEFIARNSLISNVGASTRIENAVLTDVEIDWIDTALATNQKTESPYHTKEHDIKAKLSQDKERSIDEVAGCRSMMNLIFSKGKDLYPLTEATIRGLHKELLQFYSSADRYSGSYKLYSNAVYRFKDDKKYPVLVTADPGAETELAMSKLVEWYNATIRESPWPIAVASEFVYRFLAIHPFEDGNGRLGRGLLYLTLLHSDNPDLIKILNLLPIDRHIEKNREEYYLVLRQASEGNYLADPTKYNYLPFIDFILKCTKSAFQDIEYYQLKYSNLQSLTKSELTVLSTFKEQPETRLQTKQVVKASNLARSTVSDCLRKLIVLGFIQKTGRGQATSYQLIF